MPEQWKAPEYAKETWTPPDFAKPAEPQLIPGNIDLYKQPSVPNPIEGGMSTVYSRGFNIDGREVLLPSVTPDGRFLKTDKEVLDEYKKTGKHLGIFNTPEESTAYGQQLHQQYESGKYNIQPKQEGGIKGFIGARLHQLSGEEPGVLNPDPSQNPLMGKSFLPETTQSPGMLGAMRHWGYENLVKPIASPLGLLGLGLEPNIPQEPIGLFENPELAGRLGQIAKQEVGSLEPSAAAMEIPKTPIKSGIANPRVLEKESEGIKNLRLKLSQKAAIKTPKELNPSETQPSTMKMLINTPKSIMASTDLSAPLRQGMPLITRKEWWNSLVPMVKSMTSEDAYQAVQSAIRESPNYELMKVSKLALTDVAEHGPREEAFLNSFAEHIPGIGPVIRASDRAYTGFLNKLRADTFNSLLNDAKNLGYNEAEIAPKIAKYVNTSTGRGSLGQFEKYADDLNTVMFSPRMMASRLTMLNPKYYMDQPAFLRKEALKSLLSVAGAGSTFTGIGVLAGGHTSLDPTNTDFMKLKVGDTRIDPYAGFQQYVVAATRLMKGETTSSVSGKTQVMGQGYKAPDRLDMVGRFLRNKESPAASFVHDLITQKDAAGKPIQLSNEVISRITPMMLQDLYDIAKENPKLLPLGVFGNFGMGVQTYSK